MITDLPPSTRRARELVAREVAAMLGAGLLYPFGFAMGKPRSRPRLKEQRTIVLVHGYLANRTTMLPLHAYLKLRRLGPILSFDYASTAGIERSARALKQFCRERVRGGRIDLVCHSLGGVVARCWLQELGGARRVDRCITLSSPHRGTYGAYWVASRVGRELRPDSLIMSRLEASRGGASRVKFTSVVAGSDNIVFPRVFASHEELVHVPDVGHVGMLFSPTVLRTVADRL
ncbi:MAG: putative secreted lipase [Myxococcales bacterium]|nr:putative secreted lipase [Myxococcales bacterium]